MTKEGVHVTVWLNKPSPTLIKNFVTLGYYGTISDFIRQAVEKHVRSEQLRIAQIEAVKPKIDKELIRGKIEGARRIAEQEVNSNG